MKRLGTWANLSSFAYDGSIESGTMIRYGNGHTIWVSHKQYLEMIGLFKHRHIPIGTSRDNPPKGSLGEWLKEHVTKTAIASYVGPILVDEGYAEKDKSTIIFK